MRVISKSDCNRSLFLYLVRQLHRKRATLFHYLLICLARARASRRPGFQFRLIRRVRFVSTDVINERSVLDDCHAPINSELSALSFTRQLNTVYREEFQCRAGTCSGRPPRYLRGSRGGIKTRRTKREARAIERFR